MPYQFQTQHKRIPRALDRRVKYKQSIREKLIENKPKPKTTKDLRSIFATPKS